MKYWFIIYGSLPEKEGRELWERICRYNASLTVLFDRAYVYGDANTPKVIEDVAKELAKLDYKVKRG